MAQGVVYPIAADNSVVYPIAADNSIGPQIR